MGENLYLDRDAYLQAQKTIQGVDQSLSNTYTMLNNLDFRILRDEYDYYDELSQAMTKFVIVKRRIGSLYDAMGDYLAAWDDAQDSARRRAGNVQVVTDRYSDQIFWNLYTDRIIEGPKKYEDSLAWKYATTSEKSFSEQYSDFSNFRYKSGYWPELALWARDIGSWRKSTVKGLDGDLYYEPLLDASLEGMLKGLPGYAELDTVNTDAIDWDALGKKFNIPGLKALVKKMSGYASKAGAAMGQEDFADILDGLDEIANQCADNPGVSNAIQAIADSLRLIDPKALEGSGKFTGQLLKVQEYMEFTLKMVLHCLSDHSQQVEYLQNATEALLAAGYDKDGLVSNLSYMQALYEDKASYVWQKCYDKMMTLGVDMADGAVGKLPVVKWVDLGYGTVGTVANILANDKLKAANSMMGIMQYEGALADSFNRYTSLIRAGVATQEDITRADQIFQMLCTSKITGYQNMMTIIGDKTAPGYIMALTKANELRQMIGMPAIQ